MVDVEERGGGAVRGLFREAAAGGGSAEPHGTGGEAGAAARGGGDVQMAVGAVPAGHAAAPLVVLEQAGLCKDTVA